MPKMRKALDEKELTELVSSGAKKYVTYDEAMKIYPFGRHLIEELAKDAHAKYRVRGRVAINTVKLDEYLENFCDEN